VTFENKLFDAEGVIIIDGSGVRRLVGEDRIKFNLKTFPGYAKGI
jgi:hypothetical protein